METDTQIETLKADAARAEARILALMQMMAAVIRHHPARAEVEETIRQLGDLTQTTLLHTERPEELGANVQKTVDRVKQLSEIVFLRP